VLRRNGLSRRTGLSAAYSTPALAAIEADGAALVEQSIADAGGRSELIAREVAQHEYRGLLHVRIRKLALALETHGDFDKRGRLRGAWIDRLKGLIETARQIDATLGLQRRTKRIDPRERLLQAMQQEDA
jgi:hypothetical protein